MSVSNNIDKFYAELSRYLVPTATTRSVKICRKTLDKYLEKRERERIDRSKNVEEVMYILLEASRLSGRDAFRDLVHVLLSEGEFAGVKNTVMDAVKYLNLVEVVNTTAPPDPVEKAKKKLHNDGTCTSENGNKRYEDMMNSFKNVTINRSTKDEATFKQDCLNLFDSGFQFKFVMLNAIIDDLISGKANKLMPLYDAKTAIHNLLPFALNLCRFPNRKEYKIIKKYTAHYVARIKNNLRCSPTMADSILESLGYKQSEYADEVVLDKPSKSLFDIAFEIYLCELKLGNIITMIEKLIEEPGITVRMALTAWLDASQDHRTGKVGLQDIIKYLKKISNVYIGSNPKTSLSKPAYDDRRNKPARKLKHDFELDHSCDDDLLYAGHQDGGDVSPTAPERSILNSIVTTSSLLSKHNDSQSKAGINVGSSQYSETYADKMKSGSDVSMETWGVSVNSYKKALSTKGDVSAPPFSSTEEDATAPQYGSAKVDVTAAQYVSTKGDVAVTSYGGKHDASSYRDLFVSMTGGVSSTYYENVHPTKHTVSVPSHRDDHDIEGSGSAPPSKEGPYQRETKSERWDYRRAAPYYRHDHDIRSASSAPPLKEICHTKKLESFPSNHGDNIENYQSKQSKNSNTDYSNIADIIYKPPTEPLSMIASNLASEYYSMENASKHQKSKDSNYPSYSARLKHDDETYDDKKGNSTLPAIYLEANQDRKFKNATDFGQRGVPAIYNSEKE